MKNTELMSEQTARDLFGLVFDEGGAAVPGDDLAPAAMDGYRRYRRRRRTVVGAGASAVLVGAVATVLAVGGGSAPHQAPGVWPTPDATVPSQASSSAPGSSSVVVDCFSQFRAQGDLARAQADCHAAEQLWRAVFPGAAVSGAHEPAVSQVETGFTARVRLQDVTDPALYGRAQPRVVQDWSEARQENLGDQTWSGFDIATPQGTIIVSAEFLPGHSGDVHVPCEAETPCQTMRLTDGSTAEVSGTGDVHGYRVIVRAANGSAYLISLSSPYGPRYVEVPCADPSKHCYADLTDGSIHPSLIPATEATIGIPVVTQPVLTDILGRPAFAALVKGYFAGGLGKTGAGS